MPHLKQSNNEKTIELKEFGIRIVYKPLTKGLGYFDERTGEIAINIAQKEYAKDIILIHEFLHMTASGLKQMGVIKKLPDHGFITNCATQILGLFVVAGKWNGLTKRQIKEILPKL